MSGIKISELTEAQTIQNGCCFPLVSGTDTKKISFATLKSALTTPIKQETLNGWDDFITSLAAITAVDDTDLMAVVDNGNSKKITYGTLKSLILAARSNYVIEEGETTVLNQDGTSIDCIYRKWNTGKNECWLKYRKNLAVNTAKGNLYISPVQYVNYPSGLFTSTPSLFLSANRYNDSEFVWVIKGSNNSSSRTQNFYVCSPTSLASGYTYVDLYAVETVYSNV